MKKLILFTLLFLSLAANAQMTQLTGGSGILSSGAGGGGGGGGGAGTIAVWSPGTAYTLDEISIYNETVFIREIAGTTATSPDQDTTNWSPVGLNAIPTHVAATYYQVGQVVEFSGLFYTRLIAGISAGTPLADAVNWNTLAVSVGNVSGILPIVNGGTGVDASALANGEIFIGNGAGFVSATLTGTLNQVAVANGAGSITLSTPQDIHVGASPTFVSATFSGVLANEYVKTDGASGLTSVSSIPFSDLTGIVPVAQGGSGLDASSAANGTFLIGNGTGFDLNVVSGTVNQVIATTSAGGLTLSTPQDIHVGASPTFVSATFSGILANEYLKTDGSSGLASVSSIPLSDLTGILPIAQGGTGVDASALSNGEIFIGNGAGFVSATLTGTLNQVAIVNGAGSITLSTPQDIDVTATPTFVSATFSGVLPSEFIKTDASSGLTSVSSIDVSADVSGILPIANGGTNSSTALNDDRVLVSSGGSIVESAALADGQLLIGSSGAAPVVASLLGTVNQVDVVSTSGSITLNLPQDIHAGASPTFVSATFSGVLPNEYVKTNGASGLTSSPGLTASDITGIIDVSNGGTGLDGSAAANGTFLIGNGTGFDLNVVSGTANQVIATTSAGGLTLSAPQDIHVGASPTFVSATFTGVLANEFLKTDGASGLSSISSIDLSTDISNVLPIANGGTNSATALNNDRLVYSSAGTIIEFPEMFDGNLVIGVSGSAPSVLAMSGDATLDNTGAILLTDDSAAKTLMARIGTPVFKTIQETHDITSSTGAVSGGLITDATGGNIDVSAGSGLIRASNSETAELVHFDWVASLALTPTDGIVANYIYVEYNAGAPQVIVTTTKRADLNTNILLGYVLREGTIINISDSSEIKASNGSALIAKRLIDTNPFIVSTVNPPALADEGSQNFSLSSGTFWEGLTEFTTTAFDSSGADTFDYYYRDGVGGWTKIAAQTIIDRESWDDGSGTLGAIANNRRANHWIYISQNSKVYVVFGRGDYGNAAATAALPPSDLPPVISTENHGRLIGKITSRGNDVAFETVEVRLNSQEVSSFVPTSHTSLADLTATDDHTQYVINTGRTGGQSMSGGLDASNNFTIDSTVDATKGNIILNATGGKVSVGTATPNVSAVVDITSVTKGFLPPRMTEAQRDAITTPASGLVLFNSDTNQLNYFNGTGWISY